MKTAEECKIVGYSVIFLNRSLSDKATVEDPAQAQSLDRSFDPYR